MDLPPYATAYSDSKRGGPSSVLTCLWLKGEKEEAKGFAPIKFSFVLQPENCSCGAHLRKKLLPAGWKDWIRSASLHLHQSDFDAFSAESRSRNNLHAVTSITFCLP